jgi:FkbM family methyltransferase
MINDIFDKILHYYGKNNEKLFLINIGAMDGILFDELIGYSTMYNFKGLYVEPIPYLFKKLESNISSDGNKFENSAISDYNGFIKMVTINQNAIDNNLVHNCFYGMSAIWPPKNGLSTDIEIVEKYGEEINVNCITLKTLLDKHKITSYDILSIDAEGHDYHIFKQIDFENYRPKLIRLEWNSLDEIEKESIIKTLNENKYHYEILGMNIDAVPLEIIDLLGYDTKLTETNNITEINNTTIVTGIWNIKRDTLSNGWDRTFDHYLNHLEKLLKSPNNMIIYIEQQYENFIWEKRDRNNTLVIIRELDWFKKNETNFQNIQRIRKNPNWYEQSGWLIESTQAKLEMYNPIVMSKMFLLNDASIMDPFNSTHMVWVDGALTNTVHEGYFWKDEVINKIDKYFNKFSFVTFPYDGKVEIHGFNYESICKYANAEVNKVARGGIFGGPKEIIARVNSLYYNLISATLNEGLMGTEESLFTILLYQHPDLFQYYEINNDGLLGTFFENLKNDNLLPLIEKPKKNDIGDDKIGLYVITFNSPNQFKTLIESMIQYDDDFITKTKKFLLDNSTDLTTTPQYKELCDKYGFEHIKKDNIGITGGRVFVAEHFNETDLDYYYWFEDDMFFYPKKGELCRNGFNRYIANLYQKTLKIIKKEKFDFLKLNFTEFYGSNETQFSWYNVPQETREQLWPNNKSLPEMGLDPNAPKTLFKEINAIDGLPYVKGEVYICNWPILLSKEGNYKCYLETKWAYPYEQTLMSYVFQETVKGKINPGLLLITPTEHDRFEHYDGSLRKEC